MLVAVNNNINNRLKELHDRFYGNYGTVKLGN